jgi:hypothetical protein
MTYGTAAPATTKIAAKNAATFSTAAGGLAAVAALVLAIIALLACGVDRGNKGAAAKVAVTVSVDENPHTDAGGRTHEESDSFDLSLSEQFHGISLSETAKTDATACLYTTYRTVRDDLNTKMEDFAVARKFELTAYGGSVGFDRFAEAYQAASTENCLDDPEYLVVANARARCDALGSYIINTHKDDICAKETLQNAGTTLLFVQTRAQCDKVAQAVEAFESNVEGKSLVGGCGRPPRNQTPVG